MTIWLNSFNPGQTQFFQHPDPEPTHVKLKPAMAEFGRCWALMVIVVQFLAADYDAPGKDVTAAVSGVGVAIAPPVPYAIDHSGSPKWHPCHLYQPHHYTPTVEQGYFDDEQGQESPFVIGSV